MAVPVTGFACTFLGHHLFSWLCKGVGRVASFGHKVPRKILLLFLQYTLRLNIVQVLFTFAVLICFLTSLHFFLSRSHKNPFLGVGSKLESCIWFWVAKETFEPLIKKAFANSRFEYGIRTFPGKINVNCSSYRPILSLPLPFRERRNDRKKFALNGCEKRTFSLRPKGNV